MTRNMKRKTLYIFGGLLLAAGLIYMAMRFFGRQAAAAYITAKVEQGAMDLTIQTTGELQALNSEDIKGPDGLRFLGINQVKISDLIPEGSIVKEGDYIASLDPSTLNTKIKDAENELLKLESQYTQTRLDTAIEMANLRDNLLNMKYELEQKKILLEQSKYEAPATQRQIQIDMEKAQRTYKQSQKNYKLKQQQFRAKVAEAGANTTTGQRKIENMQKLLDGFLIRAPKGGMVIYKKSWNGKKVKAGSDIYSYDMTVATLPDMSEMVSATYVNEIDISRVKPGQPVTVTVDAFPDKKFRAVVKNVANVGEELPDNDTKVFEVTLAMLDKDTMLKPAMTTNNLISTARLPATTLHIPLLAMQGRGDSLSYVVVKNGNRLERREVVAGVSGNDRVEIKAGLKKDEEVLLSLPEDVDKLELVKLDPAEKARALASPEKLVQSADTSLLREAEKQNANSDTLEAQAENNGAKEADGAAKTTATAGSAPKARSAADTTKRKSPPKEKPARKDLTEKLSPGIQQLLKDKGYK